MARFTRPTGWGLIRLRHARRLDREIEAVLTGETASKAAARHDLRRGLMFSALFLMPAVVAAAGSILHWHGPVFGVVLADAWVTWFGGTVWLVLRNRGRWSR
jgi:hypothetical protein